MTLAHAAKLSRFLGAPIASADAARVEAALQSVFRQGVASGLATAPKPPTVLWGFFWTDCYHESAPALQTLHLSKREAVRAMIRAQAERWEAGRDNTAASSCSAPLSTFDYRLRRSFERFSVRAVQVLP